MNKEFAFIIPTYNRKVLLLSALESILLQDYDLSKIEVIVVDDGGHDDTEPYIKSFITKAKLAGLSLIFVRTSNGGPSSARNIGTELANAKYGIYLDDDCFIKSDFVTKNSTRLALLKDTSNTMIEFNLKNSCIRNIYGQMWEYSFEKAIEADQKRLGKGKVEVLGCAFLMELQYMRKHLFDISLRTQEDKDLMMRLDEKALFFEDLIVYHNPRHNFKSFFRQRFSWGAGGELLNRKWGKDKVKNFRNINHEFTLSKLLSRFGYRGFFIYLLSLISNKVWRAGCNSVKWGYDNGTGIPFWKEVVVFLRTVFN